MKPVRIDFSSPSLRRTLRTTPAIHWLLAFAGAALCAGAGVAIMRMAEHQRAAEQQQRRASTAQAVAPVVEKRAAISEVQANAVNAAVLQLNLPWRDLQEAIDAATPKTVALLALEPDSRTRTLRILAEAKNSDDMVAYIEQLKQQPFFESAVLTKHEVNEQDANHPLRFALDLHWAARGVAR
ncbi:MAG: PilN domain-containing protein [Pseudomonadota bacterium]